MALVTLHISIISFTCSEYCVRFGLQQTTSFILPYQNTLDIRNTYNLVCIIRPHSKLLPTLSSKIIQTKKPFHRVLLSVLERKSQSAMMKSDDKERIIEEERENPEKVPKIQVLQTKVLTATKKPGCLGIALASFAVILSLAVFITFLGYMGMLPQKVRLTKGY